MGFMQQSYSLGRLGQSHLYPGWGFQTDVHRYGCSVGGRFKSAADYFNRLLVWIHTQGATQRISFRRPSAAARTIVPILRSKRKSQTNSSAAGDYRRNSNLGTVFAVVLK